MEVEKKSQKIFFDKIFFSRQNVVLNRKMVPILKFFFPATFWKRSKLVIKEGLREVEKKTKKKLFLKKVWVTLTTFPSPSWLKIVLSSYFLICHPTISVLFYSSEIFFLNFKVKTFELWSLFLRLSGLKQINQDQIRNQRVPRINSSH